MGVQVRNDYKDRTVEVLIAGTDPVKRETIIPGRALEFDLENGDGSLVLQASLSPREPAAAEEPAPAEADAAPEAAGEDAAA